MRPLYALHKGPDGKILGASSFSSDYDLRGWIGKLDLRDGDVIAFGEVTERPESDPDFDEVEPAIAEPKVPENVPALTADEQVDQPF